MPEQVNKHNTKTLTELWELLDRSMEEAREDGEATVKVEDILSAMETRRFEILKSDGYGRMLQAAIACDAGLEAEYARAQQNKPYSPLIVTAMENIAPPQKEPGPLPRRKMPDTRPATTCRIVHGKMKGYITVGFYPDTEKPGEVFVKMAKEGSTTQALLDVWARFASYLLQHGASMGWILQNIRNHRFDPLQEKDGKTFSLFDAVAEGIEEACNHYGARDVPEPPTPPAEKDGDS